MPTFFPLTNGNRMALWIRKLLALTLLVTPPDLLRAEESFRDALVITHDDAPRASVLIHPTECKFCDHCRPLEGDSADETVELIELRRIWRPRPDDPLKSLTFTDLLRWNDKFYYTIRQAVGHGGLGVINILSSDDEGDHWKQDALIKLEGYDLRDPKLSVTPDNDLMITSVMVNHTGVGEWTHQSITFHSADGRDWDGPFDIGERNLWLWRTTWHKGIAYNVAQRTNNRFTAESFRDSFVRLYSSTDGKQFETLVDRMYADPSEGHGTEHDFVFLEDDTAYCLLRRDAQTVIGHDCGMLGVARPPYTDWKWTKMNVKIGGPEMIGLPDGRLLVCVRRYVNDMQWYPCWVELGWVDRETAEYTPCLRLPSYDDCSYAGSVWHDGLLWISYYSCHERGEGQADAYLVKVRIRGLEGIE